MGSGLTGAIPAEAADPRRDQVAAPARSPDPRVSRSIQVRASAILFVVGAWRSLVAHLNGVQEVERSNRSAPTNDPGTNEALGAICGLVIPGRPRFLDGDMCAGPWR